VLFVGRGTYQARSWLLALLALGSSAYLLAPLDFSGDVDAAHLARLVFVTSIASLVVRHLRRAGLLLTAMIGLGALGATAHVMSVDVGAAIASFVREAASSPFELVDRERYSPVAALNIQLLDLLIIAFMLTWAHDWRIDIRGVLAATALAITTWIIAVAVTESFVPLAAVLAVMYVCLVAITALIRRQRRFRV
jgi:hypothetical protein